MSRLTRDERTNQRHWDADTPAYQRRHHRALVGDLVWGPSVPPESRLGVLGDVRGKDVLELGCGAGESLVWVKQKGARRAVGLDLSGKRIEQARAHASKVGVEVEWIVGTARDLGGLADASFDVVFSSYAFGFVPDLPGCFRECARVLRPGGLFAWSWGSPFWQIAELDGREVRIAVSYHDRKTHRGSVDASGPWVEFRHTYGDAVRWMRDAGFEVVDIFEPELDPEGVRYPGFERTLLRKVPGTTIWKALRKPST